MNKKTFKQDLGEGSVSRVSILSKVLIFLKKCYKTCQEIRKYDLCRETKWAASRSPDKEVSRQEFKAAIIIMFKEWKDVMLKYWRKVRCRYILHWIENINKEVDIVKNQLEILKLNSIIIKKFIKNTQQ